MPSGSPADRLLYLGAIKLQEVSLVRSVSLGYVLPRCAITPSIAEQVNEVAGSNAIAVIGTEVVAACECGIFVLKGSESEVGYNRLKNVLIRSCGL